MIIRIKMFETPNYSSEIGVTEVNKNYETISSIDSILKKANKDWRWLMEYTYKDISLNRYKTYFSGQENISLRVIEIIAISLSDFIDSPRDLMKESCAILKLGKCFKLNIKEICSTYHITQGDIVMGTGIDRGTVHNIVNSKTTQIREDRMEHLYNFFVSKGVPLKSVLDLIYFPYWNELPLQFIKNPTNTIGLIIKHDGYIRNSNGMFKRA